MTAITEHNLTIECQDIVRFAIFDYGQADTHEDIEDYVQDRIYEAVDGHQWVIYTYRAHELCRECETDRGEAYIDELGMTPKTYDEFATLIAFGEMLTRCQEMAYDMIEEFNNGETEAA